MSLSDNVKKLIEIAKYIEELSPKEMGEIFAKADDDWQAEFLHNVALGFKQFNGCMQNCNVSGKLSDEAKSWLDNLHSHAFHTYETAA